MSLQSLSQKQLAKSFESIPFAPEDKLKPEAAKILFNELPISCASSVAAFVESEDYYRRACFQVAKLGCRVEEHGNSFKRMFFELIIQDLLQTTTDVPRAIAEVIFTLKLACSLQDLDKVCAQLPNLSALEVKYDLVGSCRASLSCVPKALEVSNHLVCLTVLDSYVTDDDVATMFGGSSTNRTILHLNLAHNVITSAGLAVIVNHFLAPDTSVLCSLDMMGNRIDSEGGSILGQVLATNESMLSLNLRLNDLGDVGGSDIIDSMRQNETLRCVNLSANFLGSRTATALVRLFSTKSPSLEAVIITSNPFSDEDEEVIRSCKNCFLDVRGGSSPGREELFLGKSIMPF